jgi:hypothetical protein
VTRGGGSPGPDGETMATVLNFAQDWIKVVIAVTGSTSDSPTSQDYVITGVTGQCGRQRNAGFSLHTHTHTHTTGVSSTILDHSTSTVQRGPYIAHHRVTTNFKNDDHQYLKLSLNVI